MAPASGWTPPSSSATAHAADLGTVRVGVLKFGTVNWELDVIKQHGLDKGWLQQYFSWLGGILTGDAIDPRVAKKRMPMACAASMLSSRRTPLGYR